MLSRMTVPVLTVDGRTAVAAGVLCRECAYDLRGLPQGGACPECGAEVEGSVRRHEAAVKAAVTAAATGGGVPLALSSRRWVRRLAVGSALVTAAGVFHVTAVASDLADATGIVSSVLMVGLFVGTLGSMLGGLWLLTVAEPGAAERRTERAWRWSARAGVIAYLAGELGLYAVVVGNLASIGWGTALLAAGVTTSAATWLGWSHVARLARRLEGPRLRRWAAVLAWAVPLGSVARALWLPFFPLRETEEQAIPAMPMFGELAEAVLLPYSLAVWPRADMDLAAWTLLAGLGVAALAMMAALTRSLWSVVRQADRPVEAGRPPG